MVHYKYLRHEFSIVGLNTIRDLFMKASSLWRIHDHPSCHDNEDDHQNEKHGSHSLTQEWIIRDLGGFEIDFDLELQNLEDGIEDIFILRPTDLSLLEDYELSLSYSPSSSSKLPFVTSCTKERYLEWITQPLDTGLLLSIIIIIIIIIITIDTIIMIVIIYLFIYLFTVH